MSWERKHVRDTRGQAPRNHDIHFHASLVFDPAARLHPASKRHLYDESYLRLNVGLKEKKKSLDALVRVAAPRIAGMQLLSV